VGNPAVKQCTPVKLFVGMISSQKKAFIQAEAILEKKYGPADFKTVFIKFDFTDYYEQELGKNLLRKFISFKNLIDPGTLPDIKIFTNKKEYALSPVKGKRLINLDPGYITESGLVLATTKNFQHRIYLNKGIFAEVTLRYQRGEYLPYDWTYRDYQTKAYTDFFKKVRKIYKEQLT